MGGRAEEGRVVREERVGRGGGGRSKADTVEKEGRGPLVGRDAATGLEKLRKRCWRAPSSRRGRSSKQLQRRGRAGIKAGVPTTTEGHPKTATADTIETLPTTTRQSRRTCLPPSSCPPAPTNPRKKQIPLIDEPWVVVIAGDSVGGARKTAKRVVEDSVAWTCGTNRVAFVPREQWHTRKDGEEAVSWK